MYADISRFPSFSSHLLPGCKLNDPETLDMLENRADGKEKSGKSQDISKIG